MTTIIIPTAKYIPEDLQKIGKIPPILYPLEGRMVLDHILNNYGENDHVRLLCYEGVEIVRSRLKFNDLELDSLIFRYRTNARFSSDPA